MGKELPPGQRAIDHFPRFGVPRYADRLPQVPPDFELRLEVEGKEESPRPVRIEDLRTLPRKELVADFHCVTTWTRRDVRWSGYRFRDFYEQIFVPRVGAHPDHDHVELEALDGYRTCILLEDLLNEEEVLLADGLDGEPISLAHGAPLRLIVPHLYGYKSAKHLSAITLRFDFRRSYADRLTRAHPRARVAREERGRGLPGPVYRVIYRAFIRPTLWFYRRAERRRDRTR
jgi:DMSO/TMAO reductase YedYZ molybdopterin-dependent catalytic subunit